MQSKREIFIENSKKICENSLKKSVLLHNLKNFQKKWDKGKNQFSDYHLAVRKLHYIKFKNIENLEKHITEFESKFKSAGGIFYYANNAAAAIQYVLKIAEQHNCKKIVKSKSMVCEEIEFEKHLLKNNISILETDLGEYIVQLAGEKPSHITAPALHKSKHEICKLLNEKFNQNFDENTNNETIVRFVRNLLRDEYEKAQIGITGCNFLVADIGAIALTENEANAILSFTFPKIHIVIATIEKVISSIENLELFQTMLASHGTGQKITAYNHLIFGPTKSKERNGSEKVYIILLNNNRTNIIRDVAMRQAMYCIKCGACHNFCPVFRQIGGHSYLSIYNGPIGSVISPYIFGMEQYAYLPYASTLCGKCNEVCPVNIDITSLLIHSRSVMVKKGLNTTAERRAFYFANNFLLKRSRMDKFSPFIKNQAIKHFLKRNWGIHREIPVFASKSFNKIKRTKK